MTLQQDVFMRLACARISQGYSPEDAKAYAEQWLPHFVQAVQMYEPVAPAPVNNVAVPEGMAPNGEDQQ